MSNPQKNIAIVINPTRENEKALRVADSIVVLLKGMDFRHSIFNNHWPNNFDGFTEVWIIGGDGTMNWFANQYPNIQLPLALFAGGTGNDFHWMLYGDVNVEKQVELVLEASSKKVDAGVCNGKLFLNGVGTGFDGAIVKDLLGKKKLAGKASYLLSILKNIVGYHEKHCIIQMQNEIIEQDCFMISVANAIRYGGNFKVAPKASVIDELLDVNIVGRISSLKRIKYLPVIEKGGHLQLPFIQYRQVGKINIVSPQKLHAHLDGEYIFEDVFDIEILPKRFSFLY
jgi:YegS/Rv2252/BmrU family lipid kinase